MDWEHCRAHRQGRKDWLMLVRRDVVDVVSVVVSGLCDSIPRRAAALGVGLLLSSHALAAIPPYTLVGSFQKPAGAFDVLNDGRMVVLSGSQVLVQDSPTSSSFTSVGSLSSGFVSSFGAAFIDLSPDGSRLAIGNGEFGAAARVGFVSWAGLNTSAPSSPSTIAMNAFDSHWVDGSTLLVTGSDGSGSTVSVVNPVTLAARTIVSNIGGSVGGVAANGSFLFTSNGFDFDTSVGSETGDIRAVPLGAALASATPIDFESAMQPVARLLSGGSLGFDGAGNLLVGGGDVFGFSGDYGYAGVLDAGLVSSAASGGPPATLGLFLVPPGTPDNASTSLQWNAPTNELLFTYYDNNTFTDGLTVSRYAVPAPSGLGILVLLGAAAHRRRRSAFGRMSPEVAR